MSKKDDLKFLPMWSTIRFNILLVSSNAVTEGFNSILFTASFEVNTNIQISFYCIRLLASYNQTVNTAFKSSLAKDTSNIKPGAEKQTLPS